MHKLVMHVYYLYTHDFTYPDDGGCFNLLIRIGFENAMHEILLFPLFLPSLTFRKV